jgi:hypothetical protein
MFARRSAAVAKYASQPKSRGSRVATIEPSDPRKRDDLPLLIDWTAPDADLHRFLNESARRLGIFLHGRRMYEEMASVWPTAEQNPAFSEDLRTRRSPSPPPSPEYALRKMVDFRRQVEEEPAATFAWPSRRSSPRSVSADADGRTAPGCCAANVPGGASCRG